MNQHSTLYQITNPSQALSDVYRYGFNGQETNVDLSKFTEYDFRMYSPELARFTSIDPISHDFPWMSPFGFCENNPIFLMDEKGKKPRPRNRRVAASPNNNEGHGRFIERQSRRLERQRVKAANKARTGLNNMIISNGLGGPQLTNGMRPASSFGPELRPNYALEVTKAISELYEHSMDIIKSKQNNTQFGIISSSQVYYHLEGGDVLASIAYGKLIGLEGDYQAEWKLSYEKNLYSQCSREEFEALPSEIQSDLRVSATCQANNEVGWLSPLTLAQNELKKKYESSDSKTTEITIVTPPAINPSSN
jgi:RHS repeat-associated protein